MKKLSLLLLVSTLFIASCSKQARIENRLEGTWNIKEYTITSGLTLTFTDAGTIDFKDDGTGKLKLTLNLFGTTSTDESNFKWTNTGETITITDTDSTANAQVWTIEEGKRKEFIVNTTDASGAKGRIRMIK